MSFCVLSGLVALFLFLLLDLSTLPSKKREKDNKCDISCPKKEEERTVLSRKRFFSFAFFATNVTSYSFSPFPVPTHFVCIGVVNLRDCSSAVAPEETALIEPWGAWPDSNIVRGCLLGGPPAEIRGSTEDDIHCTRADVSCTVLSHELLLPILLLWFRLSRAFFQGNLAFHGKSWISRNGVLNPPPRRGQNPPETPGFWTILYAEKWQESVHTFIEKYVLLTRLPPSNRKTSNTTSLLL